MIKAKAKAMAVQGRRVKSGKRGYAKAVRRFFRRGATETYRACMNELPANWSRTSA